MIVVIRKTAVLIGINVMVFGLFTVGLEFGLGLLYRHPPRIYSILRAARKYHTSYERRTLHFMRECFRHDSELSYRLRSSRCTYPSREFDIEIIGNSAGLRDDEDSLNAPEVIALGDSHTLGWGVAEQEACPQLVEQRTGMKVLNAGIPSYGTARELLLLNQLDRSGVKALLLQYSDNDYRENSQFVGADFQLNIMRKQDYIALCADEARRLRVQPTGRYLRRFWPLIFRYLKEAPEAPSDKKGPDRREAAAFVKILKRYGDLFPETPIIAFEINSYNKNDSLFIDAVRRILARKGTAGLQLHLLELAPHLQDQHYYRHDDHMRPAGHRIAAELVAGKLAEVLGNAVESAAESAAEDV